MAYPFWLRQLLQENAVRAATPAAARLGRVLRSLQVQTVCQSARCPNLGECWSSGTATFLLLGNICTRGCRFCNLSPGCPGPVDADEPWRLLRAVRDLGLRHVVLTSVTRDDLPDGGAGHFAEIIRVLRRGAGPLSIEVLTPDFQGDVAALETLAAAAPDLWGHNLETVPRLYPGVRRGAGYERSLQLLAWINKHHGHIATKSGLMLGLGETGPEIEAVLTDLKQAAVAHLTLGQYLAPSPRHVAVSRYVSPAEFAAWGRRALTLGFASVKSAPLVRSSYTFSTVTV